MNQVTSRALSHVPRATFGIIQTQFKPAKFMTRKYTKKESDDRLNTVCDL